MAVTQRLCFQQKHQFNNLRTHFFAHTAGMRHNQIVLQLAEVFCGNGDVAQTSESGGHTVNGTADIFHLAIQELAAFLNRRDGFLAKFQLHVIVNDFFDSVDGQMLIANDVLIHGFFAIKGFLFSC